MITCKHLIGFLDDYVEGRLSLVEHTAFKAHLLFCRDCRNYVESYKAVMKLGRASGKEVQAPAASVPESLIQSILSIRKPPQD